MPSARPFCVGITALCLAGPAVADSTSSAAAQALFEQGKKLMAVGKFAEACPKLQDSQRLDPGGGTILLLARCHAREGKTASAWTEYEEALRIAIRDNRKERERIARDEGAALQPRLSKLVIDVAPAMAVPGLTIRRDGQEVGASQWSLAVAVDPGRHEVSAGAPGRASWSTAVVVGADAGVVAVAVPMLKLVSAPAPVSASPTSPAPALTKVGLEDSVEEPGANRGTSQRVIAAVAAGVGVALMGTGSYFGLKARSTNASSAGDCNIGGDRNACNARGDQLRDEARQHAMVSTILFGAGGAALLGGAALWLTAPRADTASVALGLGVGQLTIRGAW